MDSEHADGLDGAASWLPLRLRVLETSILPKSLTLAVLDAYHEVQFGRDVAPTDATPRIRLKEMAVSKLHATVFWDKERHEWAVVDMGSKHGTFLRSSRSEVRLAPPRIASVPRPLRHLDQLVIGSTTFLCHIHEDRTPCAECTSVAQGVLPLFAVPGQGDRAAEKRSPDAAGIPHQVRGPKKALTSLKRTLLARLDSPTRAPPSYVDRSARRRAMGSGSQFDSPGVQSPRTRSASPGPPKASAESAPGPLPEHNIGRQLLVKQGWQPGTSLDGEGVVEPIEVQVLAPRAGIGVKGRDGRWGRIQRDVE